ncbi:MAG TPA: hypothetical protein VMU47_15375 [Caldimonas sp.]|nr:hypothetical protein [Caldimonas sp.]
MLAALPPGHIGARDLSASVLVLARTSRRRVWRGVLTTLLLLSLCAGFGAAGYAYGHGWAPLRLASPAATAPAPTASAEPWRAELEQSRLALRMAEARGQELEHQVDALNQRLRESNEQLAFLRTAREGRRKTGDH